MSCWKEIEPWVISIGLGLALYLILVGWIAWTMREFYLADKALSNMKDENDGE